MQFAMRHVVVGKRIHGLRNAEERDAGSSPPDPVPGTVHKRTTREAASWTTGVGGAVPGIARAGIGGRGLATGIGARGVELNAGLLLGAGSYRPRSERLLPGIRGWRGSGEGPSGAALARVAASSAARPSCSWWVNRCRQWRQQGDARGRCAGRTFKSLCGCLAFHLSQTFYEGSQPPAPRGPRSTLGLGRGVGAGPVWLSMWTGRPHHVAA
jgi:hypothetical protein